MGGRWAESSADWTVFSRVAPTVATKAVLRARTMAANLDRCWVAMLVCVRAVPTAWTKVENSVDQLAQRKAATTVVYLADSKAATKVDPRADWKAASWAGKRVARSAGSKVANWAVPRAQH